MGGNFQWSVLKTYDEFALLNKMVRYQSFYLSIYNLSSLCIHHLSIYLSICLLSVISVCPFLCIYLYFFQLVEYYAIDKTLFPQRKMFGTHKKDYITELQGRLSLYLSSILQRFSLPPVHLLQFLEYKFSVSTCI